MKNGKKDNLVGFLNLVISKITDDYVKEELSKILDKVKADDQLANEDIDYVVQKGYSDAPASLDDDEKRNFIYNMCDEYNDSLSKGNNNSGATDDDNDSDNDDEYDNNEVVYEELDDIRKVVKILIDEVDWDRVTDANNYKDDLIDILDIIELKNYLGKENAQKLWEISNNLLDEGYVVSNLISDNIDDYSINDYYNDLNNVINADVLREIDKIEAIIAGNEKLESDFISDNDNIKYVVKYLKKKIETDYNAIGDERRINNLKKLESESIDDINEVINNNDYDKDDLVISVLKTQIEELESKIDENKDVKLEITDENKKDVIEEVKNVLDNKKKNEELDENFKLDDVLKELDKDDVKSSYIDEIISKLSVNKNDLFLKIYENEFNNISSKINKIEYFNKLNDTLTKIIAFERLKQQNQSNQQIDEFLNKNNKQEIQEKIKNLVENNNDIDFINREYFENLKNEKKVCEDNLEKIKNNSDYLKKQIADKNELIDKLENNKNMKIVNNSYYDILNDLVNDLNDDEDFIKGSNKKKFKMIVKSLKNHPGYSNLSSYANKDKLIKELKADIAYELGLKKQKVKIKNDKKKWYKSMAFWGGAALGVGLSFAPIPGTNGLITAGARIVYAVGKKAIKSYVEKHDGEDTKFMRVVNKVRDVKDVLKEKFPRVAKAVGSVNSFFKKPNVQFFLNGVAVGYTVGRFGQGIANKIGDSVSGGSGTDPNVSTGDNSVPDSNPTPDPSVADPVSDKVADASDVVDKVAKGQRWDISGVDNGYGFDSSTMDNRVHLNQDLAENVKIVKTKVVDGVKMVLTKSTDGDKFAWFKADDILDQGEVLKAVGRSK